MKLIQRYKQILGKDFKGFNPKQKAAQSIRANTLKVDPDKLIKKLQKKRVKLEKISWLKNGYKINNAFFSLASTPEYLLGQYYVQEAASQLPVEVLDPKPNDLVLDMAAAPGSKTTQISQLMKNKGTIIALDVIDKRLQALKNNIQRCGCKNTIIYKLDALNAERLNIKFDKILLDAPCSGNYMQEKDWLNERKVSDFKNRAKLQKQLITVASKLLNKNGMMVYSTCSLEPEECEEVVDYAIKRLGLKTQKIKTPGLPGITKFNHKYDDQIKNTKKLWPHLTKTQGFFIAKLSR